MQVPLHHDRPGTGSDDTIGFFVKRVHALQQPSKGEIWLLNGGPGGGGAQMECLIEDLMSLTGGVYDIVIPDHRGVGRSTQLNCGNSTFATPDCMTRAVEMYGADFLQGFSVTNAAKDINFVVKSAESTTTTRAPGYLHMMYGNSYGTYLAQRYMQLFPDGMDAVVLDGVCAMDLTKFVYYDQSTSAAGEAVMGLCAQDKTCLSQLGPVPTYASIEVQQSILANSLECLDKLDSSTHLSTTFLRNKVRGWLMSWDDRILIGPLYKRLLRCNAQDVKDLTFMLDAHPSKIYEAKQRRAQILRPNLLATDSLSVADHLSPDFADPELTALLSIKIDATAPPLPAGSKYPPPPTPTVYDLMQNSILQMNIGGSEMLMYKASPVSLEEVTYFAELLSYGSGGSPGASIMQLLKDSKWPVYTPDPSLASKYPSTTRPVLLVTGTTDAQTGHFWQQRAAPHYSKPNQHVVSLPGAVHASAFPDTNPVAKEGKVDCGMQITANFFKSPTAPSVDTSCVDNLLPIDFAGTTKRSQDVSLEVFNNSALWGSASAAPSSGVRLSSTVSMAGETALELRQSHDVLIN